MQDCNVMQILKALKFIKDYTFSKSYIYTDLDLVMAMVNDLDKKCDEKLKKKFNQNPYSKLFYKQANLKDTVFKYRYKKGTLGSELKLFWKNNSDDLFQKNYNLSQIKGKKNIIYMQGVLNEHDVIHCLNKLDSTPLAEVSVLAFTLGKEFRWSFFLILLSSFFISFKNSFGKNKIQGNFFFKIKYTPVVSVFRIIKEGYKNGRKTKWFLTVDWHSYLRTPIDEVRKELNIQEFPVWEDIKPKWYELLTHYKNIDSRI